MIELTPEELKIIIDIFNRYNHFLDQEYNDGLEPEELDLLEKLQGMII